jgi:hypothetical protein
MHITNEQSSSHWPITFFLSCVPITLATDYDGQPDVDLDVFGHYHHIKREEKKKTCALYDNINLD